MLASLLLASTALADHCPEEFILPGSSEHLLARIDATRDHLPQVLKIYGSPQRSKQYQDDPSYPPGSGEAEYSWTVNGSTLTVLTAFFRQPSGERVESVVAVKIGGRAKARRLRTRRGIGLKAGRASVEAAYGTKYYKGSLTGMGPVERTITYCFSDETSLEFTFDDSNRVSQIYLAPSAE